jgi:hypothetical protein
MTELFNSEYTTNEWVTVNGVNGRRVTSKANGKSIFFPAAGVGGTLTVGDRGYTGYYQSSSRLSGTNKLQLLFTSSSMPSLTGAVGERYRATPIRPVV